MKIRSASLGTLKATNLRKFIRYTPDYSLSNAASLAACLASRLR
jgi:hypothetical protein